jgi:hypothetical protein
MRVLICPNCGGFGVTQGPVLAPLCAPEGFEEPTLDRLRHEIAVYRCGACDGAGYVRTK